MSLPNGISVVICTYNGVARLQPTLEAIFTQKVDASIPWELIIIDNASTDGTTAFCQSLIDQYQFNDITRIIFEPKQGCNYSRLRGLNETNYKWLLFCDDDNHLFPDYIQKGWDILQQNESIGVLGGQGVALFESEKPSWFEQYCRSFAIGPQAKKEGQLQNRFTKLYSAGSFFRKEALMFYYNQHFSTIMVGPKGNELTRGEDTEWCFLIQLVGYDLWYSSDLKFYHFMTNGRMTWEYYLRLKAGIASGVGKLHSYEPFFKKKNPSKFEFIFSYLNALLTSNINWLQFSLRKKIQTARYSKDQLAIGNIINIGKARSYRNNFSEAYQHFKQLKRVLKNVNDFFVSK
jgi:glycosyltransferase involved in cell wall biosynthesis